MRAVLRIGGSVVASPINPDLIRKYALMLRDLRTQGHELVVVVGGGRLARELIAAARDIGLDEPSQDEIAISVSRVFAQLFLKKLGKDSCRTVPSTLHEASECLAGGKVVVMGGLRPGMTTDTVAALIAEKVKADLIIKATDQDGVYDKDPKEHSDAVKFDRLTFGDLSKVFSENKHRAGIHQIIDPEAVKILKRRQIPVVVVNGFETENVLIAIQGKPVGTLIESA
jgi:uridylate kinase